jgi:O-antigen ligase
LAQLSDTQRILSYRVAFDLFQEQIWTGVGMGDLYQEQEKKFRHLYPEANVMQPHNQFLSFLAGTGLFGFLLFCFAFIFPLFYRHSWKNIWLASFYLLFIISLFTEDTFFVSLGLSIYLFYQLSFLKFNTIE